jgi:hypothetical protein
MNHLKKLRGQRSLTAMLVLACLCLTGLVIWRASARPEDEPKPLSPGQMKTILRSGVREGLGREVTFAKPNASAKEARDSVESMADFIHARSGVELSVKTKERLAHLEHETLNGKRERISVDSLVDAVTETGLERAASMTDQEIEHAADTLHEGGSNGGHVLLRASGKGFMKRDAFIENAKNIRNEIPQSRADSAVRLMATSVVAAEVKDRVQVFSDALPEQFGDASTKGLTPVQASVVVYSVASDDLLMGSRENLQRQINRENKELKGAGKAKVPRSGKAYGVDGDRYSTPLDLVTDERTMGSLFDRIDERTRRGAK